MALSTGAALPPSAYPAYVLGGNNTEEDCREHLQTITRPLAQKLRGRDLLVELLNRRCRELV